MAFPHWPILLIIPLALCFYYFVLAGGRTFDVNPDDQWNAAIAQFSFLATGLFGTLFIGFGASVPVWSGIAAVALMLCALALYEWARHTVKERRFHIAWSGDVPDTLCESGPYRHIRHPLYASYILAFAAQLVALPKVPTVAIFLFNLALFIHAARDDERHLAASELSPEYEPYKQRTGMFFPRLGSRNAA